MIVVKRIDGLGEEGEYLGLTPTIHIKVVDYKSTNDIGHDLTEAKLDHQLQVNMYAWVATSELPAQIGWPGAKVVIDELEIVYVSMKKVRRFTSAGPRTTKGKMIQRRPPDYADLVLEPIMLLSDVEGLVRSRIEERIRAKDELPDILEGDEAWRCDFCPVNALCMSTGNVRSVGRRPLSVLPGRGAA